MTNFTKEPVVRLREEDVTIGPWLLKERPGDAIDDIRKIAKALEVDGVPLREILENVIEGAERCCLECSTNARAIRYVFGLDEGE